MDEKSLTEQDDVNDRIEQAVASLENVTLAK